MNQMFEKWVNLVIVALCCGLAIAWLILLIQALSNNYIVLVEFNTIGEYMVWVIITAVISIGSLIWMIRLSARKWYNTNI